MRSAADRSTCATSTTRATWRAPASPTPASAARAGAGPGWSEVGHEPRSRTASIRRSCASTTSAASSARPCRPPTRAPSAAPSRDHAGRSAAAARVAVGYDGRLTSPELEAALVEGLAEGGADVVRIGRGPTPMLYFAAATLGGRRRRSWSPARTTRPTTTASRWCSAGKPFFGEAIQRLGTAAPAAAHRRRRGRVVSSDVFATTTSPAWPRDYDGARPLDGRLGSPATAPPATSMQALTALLPGRARPAQRRRSTARFPNHHPDPTDPGKSRAAAAGGGARSGCDLGIAFDGDGDRIGVVDGAGRILWGDQLMLVLARDVLTPASRRHDPRRRQGEPGAVRRDRAARRPAGDGADRAFADQGASSPRPARRSPAR